MKANKITFIFIFLMLSYSAYCESGKGLPDNLMTILVGTLIGLIVINILIGLGIHYLMNRYVKYNTERKNGRKPYATIICTILGNIAGFIAATKVSEGGGFIVWLTAFLGSIAGALFGYFIFWYDIKYLDEREEDLIEREED